jgi:hypothetical protein
MKLNSQLNAFIHHVVQDFTTQGGKPMLLTQQSSIAEESSKLRRMTPNHAALVSES